MLRVYAESRGSTGTRPQTQAQAGGRMGRVRTALAAIGRRITGRN